METRSIIQASAKVIRITNLVKGDIYKRLEEGGYSNDINYGVVVNVYNDGVKTFIEALEYKVAWDEIKADRKVFSGKVDINIFPAELEEVRDCFSKALLGIEKKINEKKGEIIKLEKALEMGREFASGQLSQKLTVPEFREMSQKEYIAENIEKVIG